VQFQGPCPNLIRPYPKLPKAFVEEPQPSGHPGALVTLEELKAKCRDLGEPVSGTKAELSKRIKAKDAEAIIFEDILGLFRSMVERDGLEVLKPDAMREVRQAASPSIHTWHAPSKAASPR